MQGTKNATGKNMFWVRDKNFYRTLLVLAVPIIMQNIITHGVSLADNMMIGRLGETAISGLYFGNRVQMVLQILLFGVESAIIILASQYWGKKDLDRIKDISSLATRLTLVFTACVSLLIGVFPQVVMRIMTSDAEVIECGAGYLRIVSVSYVFFSVTMMLIATMRAVEMVRIGLINSIVALCVNVCGNYVLIYGHFGLPAMGVSGAALATVISRIVEFGVVLFYVLKCDTHLKMRLSDFRRWDSQILHDLVKYGLPLLGGQIVWAVNQFMRAFVVGDMEQDAMAAVSITDMYDALLCLGVFGLASAVGVVVGKTIGRGAIEEVKTQAKTMQVIFLGLGVLCSAVAFTFKGPFLSCYNLSPATMQIADSLMVVLYVCIIGRCYQAPSLMGLVKAGGDTSFVFKNDTVFVFCVVLPSAMLAQFHFHAPPWIVYACLLSDQVLKCFVAVVKINSFNWMKKLTR